MEAFYLENTFNFTYPKNFVRYLGTGGARFAMVCQARATGGMWFTYGGLNGVIDPGPGSLFHICRSYPALDPHSVRAVFLTHRHIDHSTDINVLTEAMTGSGREKQGAVLLPSDSVYGADPVLFRYIAKKAERVVTFADGSVTKFECGVSVEAVALIHHRVECFGLIFRCDDLPAWGMISDTKPLDYLAKRFAGCTYISINTTFPDKKPHLDHMSVSDVGELLQKLHPKLATLTHMGTMLIENNPEAYATAISTRQTKVMAGRDGMVIDLDMLKVFAQKEEDSKPAEFYELT